jgi:hypothetical protein
MEMWSVNPDSKDGPTVNACMHRFVFSILADDFSLNLSTTLSASFTPWMINDASTMNATVF